LTLNGGGILRLPKHVGAELEIAVNEVVAKLEKEPNAEVVEQLIGCSRKKARSVIS
jgi:hypothetical protein